MAGVSAATLWRDPPANREACTSADKVHFVWLVALFEKIIRESRGGKRKEVLEKFRTYHLPSKPSAELCFQVYRLVLPELDKERQVYKLKEQALAEVIAGALGLAKETQHYRKLVNWRKTQGGHFGLNVKEVMRTVCPGNRNGPTVKELNDMLDALAKAPKREDKVVVLRPLIVNMDGDQMRWLCGIILKDMKLGVSEKTVLADFHQDAEQVFNTCCDLRKTFERVAPCYPNERVLREDIVPGQMVRPQLAQRQNTLEGLMKAMQRKDYIAEMKFDGERFQLHRDGDDIHYWSKNMNDFALRGYNVFHNVVKKQIKRQRCVLDGELVIWHKSLKSFVPFGSIRTVMNSARDSYTTGAARHEEDGEEEEGGARAQLLSNEDVSEVEVWFMAFDILYDGDHSVIDRPLRERHEILRNAVNQLPEGDTVLMTAPNCLDPIGGVIKLLLPDTPWSRPVSTAQEVDSMLRAAMDRNEEGLVFKDLASAWQKGDRSNSWMKMKPDYLPTDDLDLLIIGGYMGTGTRRGGKLSEWLLALAESPRGGGEPNTFRSFCKVGTGFSEADLEHLRQRLAPVMGPGGRGSAPPCYRVTGDREETPDAWVTDPRRSVVLRVKADVRLVGTNVFATPYSLRFPRATAVAWEQSWADVFTDVDLDKLVADTQGKMRLTERGGKSRPSSDQKPKAAQKAKAIAAGGVTGHAPARAVTNLAGVEVKDELFQGETIFLLHAHSQPAKDDCRRLVKEHGGMNVMALTSDTTRVVSSRFSETAAADSDVAKSQLDVLTLAWLHDCVAAGKVLAPQPKHRLRFYSANRDAAAVDRFGDSYTEDVDQEDMRALLRQAAGAAAAAKHAASVVAVAAPSRAKGKAAQEAAHVRDATLDSMPHAADVGALLAEERLLDGTRYGRMRGYRLLLLPLPARSAVGAFRSQAARAAAAADDCVRAFALARLAQTVALHGGEVHEVLQPDSTHAVAMPHEGWAPGWSSAAEAPTVEEVEAALDARPHQELPLLRSRLFEAEAAVAAPLFLVSRQWLDVRLDAAQLAATLAEGAHAPRPPSELHFQLARAHKRAAEELLEIEPNTEHKEPRIE